MTNEELLAALEAATGPSRDLDGAIYVVVHGWTLTRVGKDYDGQNECEIYTPNGKLLDSFCYPTRGSISPYYHIPSTFCPTSSIDAALTLVPEGWFGRFEPRFYIDGEIVRYRGYCIRPKWARYTPMDDWFDAAESPDVHTPFSALCIAALRARSAQP